MIPRALTIAGSDSGAGAGIQGDLKTFAALNVYGLSVVTAVTAQDTYRIGGVFDLPADFVRLQLDSVVNDIGVDAAKTGMLSNMAIVEAVASGIQEHRIGRLVIDPVMEAKSGDCLLREDAYSGFARLVLPLAMIVTPNIPEGEILSDCRVRTLHDMRDCSKRILDYGCQAVLLKGGHLHLDENVVDVFYDGRDFVELTAKRIPTTNTHGTGCAFSAAITAYLAKGVPLFEAVMEAKAYVMGAIEHAFGLGRGHGPLDHFWMQRSL
jgi:hydroxymethylpyrimidine/phosphomethylpyrimidine kinase